MEELSYNVLDGRFKQLQGKEEEPRVRGRGGRGRGFGFMYLVRVVVPSWEAEGTGLGTGLGCSYLQTRRAARSELCVDVFPVCMRMFCSLIGCCTNVSV